MTEIDTSAEAVAQRCELLRLLGMALAAQFPRDPRFVGMFDGDIALLRALAADRDALRGAWLRVIQAENSCEATGKPCNAKRCGCKAEQDMLIKDPNNG
jgi:hypothetical protein